MAQKSQAVTRLQHSYALSPVTALAFYDAEPDRPLLLAGEDTWFKVYDVQSTRLLGQLKVFYSQPIHGIHVSQSINGVQDGQSGILIWGGHSVTLLSQSSLEALITGRTHPRTVESRAPDWIYDGLLFPSPVSSSTTTARSTGNSSSASTSRSESKGVLITAHNEILPFSTATTNDDATPNLLFGPLTSPSRPILYSANLCLLSSPSNTVLVAAGTVFGEIIVWKYHADGHLDSEFETSKKADTGLVAGLNGEPYGELCGARKRYEVLYVFTGHEGSIFGVSIAPELVEVAPGVSVRLLASCSDDRTVRIWDISEGEDLRPNAGAGSVSGSGTGTAGQNEGSAGAVRVARRSGDGEDAVNGRALLDQARETGFGGDNNSEVREGNRNDSARCVAVAMGHVSRIWHVKFGKAGRSQNGAAAVEVYSFGEDCSRQRWELDLDLERWRSGADFRGGTLRHCDASTCHSGKNIWSAAVLNRGESEPLIATGGADGKIVVSGKAKGAGSSLASIYEDLDLSLTYDDVLHSLQASTNSTTPRTNTKTAFQRYAFLSDTVMATTAAGTLFLATMGEPLVWEEAPLPEAIVADLRSYNVLKSPAKDTALLGSASGMVYVFQQGHGARKIASLPEKIADIVLLDGPNHSDDEQAWSVVINVLGLDHAVLLHFDPITNTATVDSRKIKLQEHYIVTAAAFCSDTLILGSRTGSVTVYTTNRETDDFVPTASRKDCKTKDAITSIVPIPGSASSFLATCRDGKYRIYTIDSSASSLGLQHEISPPLNTLEAAYFTTPDPLRPETTKKSQLILHGFRGPNFLTYNDSTRSILSSTPCGGAHRPFAIVSCPHDPGQTRFVFSKARTLRVVSQCGETERILRSGGHGREIKSLASSCPSSVRPGIPTRDEESRQVENALIATAAEDTTIRLWRHHPPRTNPTTVITGQPPNQHPQREMECRATLEGHSAGIQSLRFFIPDHHYPSTSHESQRQHQNGVRQQQQYQYLLSSAGSEELFVWRISRVDSESYDALAVVREAVWDDHTAERDLRIVDFDVASWSTTTTITTVPPNAGCASENKLLITLALSDSSIRSYIYSHPNNSPPPQAQTQPQSTSASGSTSSGTFTLLASGRYTGACPTQARHLRTDAHTGTVHVLTAFTDGHLAVWTTQQDKGDGPGDFTLSLVVQLHQSSIKSLDLATLNPGRWLIATGGDDNALGFLDLAYDEDKARYVVRGRYRVSDAHAAAVTGLCVVKTEEEEDGVTEVATVSNDQRVKLWRAERTGADVRVALLDNRYSSVADAGDLEVVAPGKVMVGGVGMEIWDVAEGGTTRGG